MSIEPNQTELFTSGFQMCRKPRDRAHGNGVVTADDQRPVAGVQGVPGFTGKLCADSQNFVFKTRPGILYLSRFHKWHRDIRFTSDRVAQGTNRPSQPGHAKC